MHHYRKALLGPKAAEMYRQMKRSLQIEESRSKRSVPHDHHSKKHRDHPKTHSRRYRNNKSDDDDWDLFFRKKRVPKMGASTSVRQRNNLKSVRRKEGGGRGRKKSGGFDEPDPELGILIKPKIRIPCEVLSSEPFVNIEFVKHGKDPNVTYGPGTVVRVACGKGYRLNMEINSTAKCVKGKWKPVKPECSISK